MSTYEYGLSFEVSYSDGRSGYVEALVEAARSYPVPGSKVRAKLSGAAQRLKAAEAALAKRRYTKGKKELEGAASALAPVGKLVQADWAALEKRSGIRLVSDGAVSDGGSEERVTVEEWLDGDTFVTSEGKVRLIGVDTPEMADRCSLARDAKEYAEYLAPVGTELTLTRPYSENDTDKDGRLLRYVDLEDGTDIGYSLLMSDLAKARYDSRDGYQWHPREGAYRATGAQPDPKGVCQWESAIAMALVAEEGDENDEAEQDRARLRKDFTVAVKTATQLPKLAASAKAYHIESDRDAAEWKRESDSGGGGGSFDVPGWLCPTRFC